VRARERVDAMSGVSGRIFPAAYGGLYPDKTFGGFDPGDVPLGPCSDT
jgi:hypothetical protein